MGAVKGGTTALDWFLSQHPSVCTAYNKETHFFDDPVFFEDGDPDYDWYHLSFAHVGDRTLVGEAAPTYMHDADAPDRLRSYKPDIKLIFLLRNPIDRAYSHFNMNVKFGRETRPFLDALHDELHGERAHDSTLPASSWSQAYIRCSRYGAHLTNVMRFFDREQMLVLRTEVLRSDHDRTLLQVYDFLGLDTDLLPEPKTMNSFRYQRPLLPEEKSYLLEQLEPDIAQLEGLLAWDLRQWRA